MQRREVPVVINVTVRTTDMRIPVNQATVQTVTSDIIHVRQTVISDQCYSGWHSRLVENCGLT